MLDFRLFPMYIHTIAYVNFKNREMNVPLIFLDPFFHNKTPLLRISFEYLSKQLKERFNHSQVVHFSFQYNCYYIRNSENEIEKLKKLLSGFQLIHNEFKSPQVINTFDDLCASVLIITVLKFENKAVVKLPVPFNETWTDYLKSLGAFYDVRRRLWLIRSYDLNAKKLEDYFSKSGVKIIYKLADRSAGIGSIESKDYKPNEIMIDEELQDFIKAMTLQGAQKRTIENYVSQIKHLKKFYKGRSIVDITDKEIRDYLYHLRNQLNYSYSSQNLVVCAVKRYFESVTERVFNSKLIPLSPHKKVLPKTIEKEEVAKVLNVAMNLKHKTILYLLYSTGVRLQELLNLKVEDVSFENKVIIVKNGKGGKDRIVVLSDKVKSLLSDYYKKFQPIKYLLEGVNGAQYSATSVRKIVNRAKEKAGIEKPLTPHVFRHSFATHLHDSGIDIRNIQVLLGHQSTKTTEIYTHVSKHDIRKLKSPLDDLDL